jgi:hypothetical protein
MRTSQAIPHRSPPNVFTDVKDFLRFFQLCNTSLDAYNFWWLHYAFTADIPCLLSPSLTLHDMAVDFVLGSAAAFDSRGPFQVAPIYDDTL